MLSTETFISWAKELGFAEAGFCRPDPFTYAQKIVASQESLSERRQLRFSPTEDFPQAKSIAVLLWPYIQAQLPEQEGIVFVDSYYAASNAAYHAAKALEERMLASGCFAKANVSYPAKEAAIRAGMGVIGRNSLLITPAYGSRVVIILMVTGIEIPCLPIDSSVGSCAECGRCTKACPVGAIDDKGMTHPQRCLRNFMMEGVVVPEQIRSKIGMRMIGCDICQRVCPMQPEGKQQTGQQFSLREFLTEDPAAFSNAVASLAHEIGRNTARPQRVRAQAALLAGNSKDKSYLPILRSWARMSFEAVRQHALWAIEQIESADADT